MTETYYVFGVELLSKKTHRPIEHITYEEVETEDEALALYNNYEIGENEGKYLYVRSEDDETLIASEGYPEEFENEGATSYGIKYNEEQELYSLNDFRVGDFAFETAFAEIRNKKLFDEFGNLVKEEIEEW